MEERRQSDPAGVAQAAKASMRGMSRPCSLHAQGVPTLDYGNNIRQMAFDMGLEHAFDFPGFVPPISGRYSAAASAFAGRRSPASGGHLPTDQRVKELIPDDRHLHHWLDMARRKIAFQGLPARICWVGLGQRHRLGLAFNEMVRRASSRRRW